MRRKEIDSSQRESDSHLPLLSQIAEGLWPTEALQQQTLSTLAVCFCLEPANHEVAEERHCPPAQWEPFKFAYELAYVTLTSCRNHLGRPPLSLALTKHPLGIREPAAQAQAGATAALPLTNSRLFLPPVSSFCSHGSQALEPAGLAYSLLTACGPRQSPLQAGTPEVSDSDRWWR